MIVTPVSPADLATSFSKMREGILYGIIGSILAGGSLLFLFLGLLAISISPGIGARPAEAAIGMFVVSIVGVLIGAVLWLWGFYGKFIPGVEQLRKARPEYSTATSLIRIGFIWGLVLLIIGAILTLIVIGILLVIVGYILLILGYVGMIILCFNLNSSEGNSLYLIAGILLIIGIFIPILGFIAYILMYVALGDAVRKYSSMQPAPPATPQPSPTLPPPI